MLSRIKYLRLSKGDPLGETADEIGMQQTTLSMVENGRLSCPQKWQENLAVRYGKPVTELFDNRGFALAQEVVFK